MSDYLTMSELKDRENRFARSILPENEITMTCSVCKKMITSQCLLEQDYTALVDKNIHYYFCLKKECQEEYQVMLRMIEL